LDKLIDEKNNEPLTWGLALLGQDVVNFGCSSLSAAVPADRMLFGFLFLSSTSNHFWASVVG